MITTADLKTQTKADLAKMAKRLGVSGFGSMRKEDLVVAVAKASKSTKGKSTTKTSTKRSPGTKGATGTKPRKQTNGHATPVSSASSSTGRGGASTTSPAKSIKSKGSAKASPMKPKSSKTGTSKSSQAPVAKMPATKMPATRAPVSKAPATKKAGTTSPAKALPADSLPKSKRAEESPQLASKNSASASGNLGSKNGVVSAEVSDKSSASKLAKGSGKSAKNKPAPSSTDPKVLKRIRELQLQRQSDKDIAFRPTLIRPPGAPEPIWEKEPLKDRIVLFVRDAHWMHASWDITRNAIERAKAAMLEQWHGAKPILRLIRMDDTGTTNTAETVERDIDIHGGSRNWYIEWNGEPASFRVLIGYLSPNGRFHAMAKSNIVKTLGAGSPDAVDEHWSDLGAESERIYAISGGYDGELESGELKEMLEDRLHRTLGAPPLAKLGAGADSPFRRRGGFHFDMDVELVVYGSTVPDGYLTLNGEPVKLRSDGTFALRVPFPDRRQVLPAVACSRDGSQQRTIVVAVERNTKIMEPLESEQDTGE